MTLLQGGIKKMKRNLCIILLIMLSSIIFGVDFSDADTLYDKGKYYEGLNVVLKMHNDSNPDPAVIWRISRFYYEIGDGLLKEKKAKIKQFSQALKFSEPYLEIKNGNKEDRAQVVFWYAAILGARGEVIGIKESLDTVPVLFKLADKSIAIDPTFAAPYLLKGRIDDAVPDFLGGDKFRMGENFSMAIKMNIKDLNILVDAAKAFIKRNWDGDKKQKMAEKKGKNDGTPQNLSDKEHAKQLLDIAIKTFSSMQSPAKRDEDKFNEAKNLLQKLK